MLIAATTDPIVLAAIRHALGFPNSGTALPSRLVEVSSLTDALEQGAAAASVLVLDQQLLLAETRVRELLRVLLGLNPVLRIYCILRPLTPTDVLLTQLFALAGLASDPETVSLIKVTDAQQSKSWVQWLQTTTCARAIETVREQLLERLRDTVQNANFHGVWFNYCAREPGVLAILRHLNPVTPTTMQRKLTRELAARQQPTLKHLTIGYRLLLYTYYRDQGWKAQQIATAMGLSETERLRKQLKDCTGCGPRVWQHLRYAAALPIVVAFATGQVAFAELLRDLAQRAHTEAQTAEPEISGTGDDAFWRTFLGADIEGRTEIDEPHQQQNIFRYYA